VAVEVGADLVALLPGEAELLDGVGDALLVVEADVGAAGRVLRRLVLVALVLRQQVHAAQEVGHRRVVVLGDLTEVGEELLAVLPGAVPREDDELRGLLTGLEPLGPGQVRLRTGVRGGAVADEADRVLRGPALPGLLRT
jgi:hypothetical protein